MAPREDRAGPEWLPRFARGATSSAQDYAQLAAIVLSSSDAIVGYGLDGTIMTWNPAAERLYGFSAEEAIGQPLDILSMPESRGEMTAILTRIRTERQAWQFETVRQRKDGSAVYVSVTISPIFDRDGVLIGISGISRDISERVRLEEARRRAEEQLRAITDSVIDAIVAMDSQGLIIAWNHAAVTMFGYNAEEAIGKPVEMLMPERYRERHRMAMARVAAGGAPRLVGHIISLHGLRRDGSEFPLDLSLGMWASDGCRYFSGVLRDKTRE